MTNCLSRVAASSEAVGQTACGSVVGPQGKLLKIRETREQMAARMAARAGGCHTRSTRHHMRRHASQPSQPEPCTHWVLPRCCGHVAPLFPPLNRLGTLAGSEVMALQQGLPATDKQAACHSSSHERRGLKPEQSFSSLRSVSGRACAHSCARQAVGASKTAGVSWAASTARDENSKIGTQNNENHCLFLWCYSPSLAGDSGAPSHHQEAEPHMAPSAPQTCRQCL